jgi:hypothetical protein
MSKYDSRIREHGVWQKLNQLGPAIDKALLRPEISPDSVDTLERAKELQTYIGRKLAAADPRLVSLGVVDSIGRALDAALPLISSFESSGDVAQLETANNSLEAAAGAVPQLLSAVTTDDLSGLSEAASTYRSTLEAYTIALSGTTTANQQRANELAAAVEKLSKTVEVEQEKVSKLVADYQSQFSAGQTSRVEQAAQAEATRKDKFDVELKALQAEFEEQKDTNQKTFEALVNDFNQKLEVQNSEFAAKGTAAQEKYVKEVAEIKSEILATVTKIHEEVKAKKEEVEVLVGVIGNLGASSGYQKVANQARWTQIIWQIATVLSLGGVIGVALYSFIPPIVKGEAIPWEFLLARAIMIATVGILAAYTSSQADKQYQIERRNRKLAVELESLGAFITPLPPDEQAKFRYDIGQKSFGRWEDERGHEPSPATLLDLLKEAQKNDPGIMEALKGSFGTLLDRITKK